MDEHALKLNKGSRSHTKHPESISAPMQPNEAFDFTHSYIHSKHDPTSTGVTPACRYDSLVFVNVLEKKTEVLILLFELRGL